MQQHDIQLRPRQAAARLGIAVSTFWAWAKSDPDFPKLVRFGSRCTSVSALALDEYIQGKAQKAMP